MQIMNKGKNLLTTNWNAQNGNILIVDGSWTIYQIVNVRPNTTYVLQLKLERLEGAASLRISIRDYPTNVILRDFYITASTPVVFSTQQNTMLKIFLVANNTTTWYRVWDIQLEEGSAATEYTPSRSDYLEIQV